MRLLSALALALLVAPLAWAGALPAAAPGVPTRAVEGGFEITFPDGFVAFTHGADPVPGHLSGAAFPAAPRAPVCVEALAGERHGLVIYAYPLDRSGRAEDVVPQLREMVALANGLLAKEAMLRGAPTLDYRMACADGEVRVDVVPLPFVSGRFGADSTGLTDYYRIVAALRAMGYDDPMAKYWIWYDDKWGCLCGGVADAPRDPHRSPNSIANTGPNYAITFGYEGTDGAFILMHENAHNLGAVAVGAPASSGAGHCNDGRDVMCYNDGGPTSSSFSNNVCRDRVYFDCNHDTYFDVRAEPGTYLTRSWNLGAPFTRWLQGCLYEERLVLTGESTTFEIPEACRGARFAAFGEHGAPPVQFTYPYGGSEVNKVEVCWYAEDAPLTCHTGRSFHEGEVPAAATRAIVTKTAGADPRVLLHVI